MSTSSCASVASWVASSERMGSSTWLNYQRPASLASLRAVLGKRRATTPSMKVSSTPRTYYGSISVAGWVVGSLAVARGLLGDGKRSMLAWVLADNPSRTFYEAVGGKLLGRKDRDRRGHARRGSLWIV
jgi:hypothetical protein